MSNNLSVGLRDYILNELDQITIFSEYFEIPETEIQYCINNNVKTCNPIRIGNQDKNPSLSFRWYNAKLIARDFGDIHYRGDVFEIVGAVLNKDCRDSYQFVEICNDIIDNCSKHKSKAKRLVTDLTQTELSLIQKPQLGIDIITKCISKLDYLFYNQFGIQKAKIDNAIFPVKHYYLDGWLAPYKYHKLDPCYAYVVNPNKYKLYFPYRNKKGYRFISNNHFPIECIHTLKQIDYLILIKAIKDKLLIDSILENNNITNVLVLSLASESTRIHLDIMNLLFRYVDKKIFTLFDNDLTGLTSMSYYKDTYGFEPIHMMKGYDSKVAKDPTDLCKVIKYKKTEEIFMNIYNTKINVY